VHRALVCLAAGLTLTWSVPQPPEPQGLDWPQFRGPDGQGHSAERNLPLEWNATTNIAWKMPVPGAGWSSPVVGGGRVWVTTAVGTRDVSLRVVAFDLESGREVVNAEVFRIRGAGEINQKNSHASPTPVLDADRLYVHFGAEGTAAVSLAGDVIWKTRFPYISQHGSGGSPMALGDLVILSCDGGDNAFVVALDKKTGKPRWRTWRRSPWDQAYTTPLAIRVAGRDQVVSVGAYRAAAYDPETGREIWRVSYADGFSNVPRPVFGHGLVYIATGFQQPSIIAVRADGTGDVSNTHVAWTLTRGGPFTPSPLLVGDALYVVSDGGILSALDAKTGAVRWVQRLPGNYSASPIYADGRIYFQSEEGVTTVIAPGPEFTLLGRSQLGEATLASTAVAARSFLVRGERHLYRIALPRRP
jgi:outer membrane protein assembly factor BamB